MQTQLISILIRLEQFAITANRKWAVNRILHYIDHSTCMLSNENDSDFRSLRTYPITIPITNTVQPTHAGRSRTTKLSQTSENETI